MYKLVIKRIFDVIGALMGLILLLPLFALIYLWIKSDMSGPVFFRQWRVGKDQRPFRINKFRTMVTDAERRGSQITVGGDSRITRIGRVLRKYKLDELPQLSNVLLGQMSLVGPRPEVPHYVSFYSEEQKQVFSVRPGITDWASIKYRSENDLLSTAADPEKEYIEQIMPDKLQMNLEYIHNASLVKDIVIIGRTVFKLVFKGKNWDARETQ
jgi:lipopolysaccharide/colanic/teichoic acid biosynthesis glycosyltransferase